MKALDEYILIVLFLLLLKRVHFLALVPRMAVFSVLLSFIDLKTSSRVADM